MIDPKDFCAIHGYEPMPRNPYRICGECFHAFATAEELVIQDQLARQHHGIPNNPEKPENVTICPVCTHDF